MKRHNILITGARGYIGQQLVSRLKEEFSESYKIIAMDIQPVPIDERLSKVEYIIEDIRSPLLKEMMEDRAIDTVIHLAAIVNPEKNSNRDFEYSVDVLGTQNLLEACVTTGVKRFVVTSSGAAYGYHKDNPALIKEEDPIRGNEEFAYSFHKRLVEEMLAEYRQTHPQLEQVIFRAGTILGKNVNNQITAFFDRNLLPRLVGTNSPFVFIWDQDIINCLIKAIDSPQTGIFNVAGDGTISMRDVARVMGKRCLIVPAWLLRMQFFFLKVIKRSPHGGEVVKFLQYRPVLSNKKLKEVFEYVPQLTSKQVFELFVQARSISGIY